MTSSKTERIQLDYLAQQVERLSKEVGRLMARHQGRRGFSSFGQLPLTAAAVDDMIQARRSRDTIKGSPYFSDPAWDIILSLMRARLAGETLSISDVCREACAPPTTALRWIATLEAARIVMRTRDGRDGRRVFLYLSDDGAQSVVDWYTNLCEARE